MATVTTDKEPTRFRSSVSRGLSNTRPVEREGGDYGAGVIHGASLITRGEALGHGAWVDQFMVKQTVDKVNGTGDSGLKVRFTHPGLSSDGLGKLTARAKNARLSKDKNKAFADLHIVESSRDTPDGDLGGYVMTLAEKDGDTFGTSIVFFSDEEAEAEFENDHLEEVEVEDYQGRPVKRMRFRSPDEQNTQNLPHRRIGELRAVDVVDEPAANPDGLFHRESSDIAANATQLIEYCLGDRDDAEAFNGINPERAKQFFNRFLENHDLEVIPKMSTKTETPEVDKTDPADQFADRKSSAALYKSEFGDVLGPQYFCEGLSIDEARAEFNKHQFAEKDKEISELQSQVELLKEEKAGLQKKVDAAKAAGAGEEDAFDTGGTHDETPKKESVTRFADGRK